MIRKQKQKITFSKILDDVLDRDKWQKKWTKIKEFVKKKRGQNGEKGAGHPEKDDVFNAILALYAEEEEKEVFQELNALYEQYPSEIEFYIPQLCTYLFHFDGSQQRGANQAQVYNQRHRKMLEDFLLLKAKSSINFAHLLFWYIIAGLDDSESIQLSQHKNPQVWQFLKTLIDTVEFERQRHH